MQIPGYRVIRKINQGGMSTVYLAIQISVGRVVALKVMSPTLNGDPAFSERFQREANIVGQLSHPNIVAIYDIGRHENLNYIAMDYLPGGSVHDQMMKGINTADALRITCEIAIALDHAHEKGYIHRDIKPENILFRADGSAVLTDFGVAKGMVGVSRMTSVGQVVGTPHYMSPEQTRGKPVDARSDLYSLGVVCYEMLTGSVPFQGDEAVAIAIKHISAPVPRLPRQYQIYQKIIDKLLAKDPEQRFQRGRDLVEAIESAENSQKAAYGQAANPNDLSTLELFKALMSAAGNALRWRLRKLLQLRWTPQQGFYRHETPSTEIMFTGDDDRNTVIATRIQQATNLQALLNPRQRLGLRVALVVGMVLILGAGISLFFAGSQEPEDSPVIAQTTPTETPSTGIETVNSSSSSASTTETSIDDKAVVSADSEPHNAQSNEFNDANFDERATLEPYPPFNHKPGSTTEQIIEPVIEPVVDTKTELESETESTVDSTLKPTPEIVAKPLLYGLTLSVEPDDALIRILNIAPRYTPGISLAPGRYHIEVSHPGYLTQTTWITLADKDLTTQLKLEKKPSLPRQFASQLPNGQQGPAMITIPPGSFTMGNKHDSISMPLHTVTISKAFAISQFEVTFADYDLFAKATERALPGDNRWGRGNRPVINVNWDDAQAYAQWLSKLTGKTYRLPSESEWEYVARAGTSGNHWWGDNAADAAGKANCRRGCNSRFSGLFGSKTAPVGSYSANNFDVYDTAGNVAEWTQDCYLENYNNKPTDGSAYNPKVCASRVVRGGSAKSNVDHIAIPLRDYHPAEIFEEHLGFRVVMELE